MIAEAALSVALLTTPVPSFPQVEIFYLTPARISILCRGLAARVACTLSGVDPATSTNLCLIFGPGNTSEMISCDQSYFREDAN